MSEAKCDKITSERERARGRVKDDDREYGVVGYRVCKDGDRDEDRDRDRLWCMSMRARVRKRAIEPEEEESTRARDSDVGYGYGASGIGVGTSVSHSGWKETTGRYRPVALWRYGEVKRWGSDVLQGLASVYGYEVGWVGDWHKGEEG